MRAHAVVIGIDAYGPERWRLGAAVDDALGFAKWALTKGGVAPEDLVLLLSPTDPPQPGDVQIPASEKLVHTVHYEPATWDKIQEVVNQSRTFTGDRLYFYYAGHGTSMPGLRGEKRIEPLLIPVDLQNIQTQDYRLIGFSEILPKLLFYGPQEQFFFLDACRDFDLERLGMVAAGQAGKFLWPAQDPNQSRRDQYIIYATAPGQRASELSQGVFGSALVEALNGCPGALSFGSDQNGDDQYQVTFSQVFEHVKRRVKANLQNAVLQNASNYVQTPEVDVSPSRPDAILATLRTDEVKKVPVRIRLGPGSARKNATVSVEYPIPGHSAAVLPPITPPVPLPWTVELLPAKYRLIATSGSMSARQLLPVTGPTAVTVTLNIPPASTPVAMIPVPPPPMLHILSFDDHAVVLVREPAGKEHEGIGGVWISTPAPGIYTARLRLPQGLGKSQAIDFPTSGPTFYLAAGGLEIDEPQVEMLAGVEIHARSEQYSAPSETLGEFAELRLATVLAAAAYAAFTMPDDRGHRLRNLGVTQVKPEHPDDCWVTLLLGANGQRPAGCVSVSEFLDQSRATIIDKDGMIGEGTTFRPLQKFAAAGELWARVPPGPVEVELRLPSGSATRYALHALPNRASVMSVVMHDDGRIETQFYLFRNSTAIPDPFAAIAGTDPQELRLIEQGMAFYTGNEPMPTAIAIRLLKMKGMDPLMACIAGYMLARVDPRVFYGADDDSRARVMTDIVPGQFYYNNALANLLSFFGSLPDVHVLAGIYDPPRRLQHYQRALELGLPLCAEGFLILTDYFREFSESLPTPLARVNRLLLPGAVFTSWLAWQPVLRLREGKMDPPPSIWMSLEPRRDALEQIARSVGSIRSQDIRGTGFLVAPNLILTAEHVVGDWQKNSTDDAPSEYWFDTAESQSHQGTRIVELIAIDRDSRLALLRIDPPLDVLPLPIAPPVSTPRPGGKVVVIGYPAGQGQTDSQVTQFAFQNVFGFKRLQPGEIISIQERTLDHDAFTLPGNGGSPVIDLETLTVLGVHWGGKLDRGGKRNRAAALWKLHGGPILTRLSEFL